MKVPTESFVAEEGKLIKFFRDEGAPLGVEGDDAGRTPVEQAIQSMRDLLKIRADLALARHNNVMRLAVPRTCINGHAYYHEQHSASECPYCLKIQTDMLQAIRERVKLHLSHAYADLK